MRLALFISLIFLFSCGNDSSEKNQRNENKTEDSIGFSSEKEMESSDEKNTIVDKTTNGNNSNDITLPAIDTTGESLRKEQLKNVSIETRVFKNTEINGYGYDILMDGKIYVHQPNIPALPGNNGFASEKQANLVANLVSHKIRNNIMPPTVEVRELDSLGIK